MEDGDDDKEEVIEMQVSPPPPAPKPSASVSVAVAAVAPSPPAKKQRAPRTVPPPEDAAGDADDEHEDDGGEDNDGGNGPATQPLRASKRSRSSQKTPASSSTSARRTPSLWYCLFCCCCVKQTCSCQLPREGTDKCASLFCCLNAEQRCCGLSCRVSRRMGYWLSVAGCLFVTVFLIGVAIELLIISSHSQNEDVVRTAMRFKRVNGTSLAGDVEVTMWDIDSKSTWLSSSQIDRLQLSMRIRSEPGATPGEPLTVSIASDNQVIWKSSEGLTVVSTSIDTDDEKDRLEIVPLLVVQPGGGYVNITVA